MAYTPVASDQTNPLDTVDRSTAAAEFRTMKTYFNGLSTVASSATPDIFNGTNHIINYTGTALATGFVAAPIAGADRTLLVAAAAQFTAGANMIIDGVPSGTTVTLAVNTIMRVYAVTTTQFRLLLVSDVGTIQGYLGEIRHGLFSVAPAGWLLMGTVASNISRTTYANLFALIGTMFGAGDGVTTFGAPWIPSTYSLVQALVASTSVGTSTVGNILQHAHAITDPGHRHAEQINGASAFLASGAAVSTGVANSSSGDPSTLEYTALGTTGIAVSAYGGAANAAAGIYVRCIIKY